MTVAVWTVHTAVNVIIKGITWNRCGDTNHPSICYTVGFGITINVSIIPYTFQYSKVCIVVSVYTLSSGNSPRA